MKFILGFVGCFGRPVQDISAGFFKDGNFFLRIREL